MGGPGAARSTLDAQIFKQTDLRHKIEDGNIGFPDSDGNIAFPLKFFPDRT